MLPIGMVPQMANATSQPRSRGSIGMNNPSTASSPATASSTAMPIASGRPPTVRLASFLSAAAVMAACP